MEKGGITQENVKINEKSPPYVTLNSPLCEKKIKRLHIYLCYMETDTKVENFRNFPPRFENSKEFSTVPT